MGPYFKSPLGLLALWLEIVWSSPLPRGEHASKKYKKMLGGPAYRDARREARHGLKESCRYYKLLCAAERKKLTPDEDSEPECVP